MNKGLKNFLKLEAGIILATIGLQFYRYLPLWWNVLALIPIMAGFSLVYEQGRK